MNEKERYGQQHDPRTGEKKGGIEKEKKRMNVPPGEEKKQPGQRPSWEERK